MSKIFIIIIIVEVGMSENQSPSGCEEEKSRKIKLELTAPVKCCDGIFRGKKEKTFP